MNSVQNRCPGRRVLFSAAVTALVMLMAGCSSAPQTVQQKPAVRYPVVMNDLTEDARATCSYAGGTPSLVRELNGAQTSVCQFANGKRCDERALLSGSCGQIL